jgi:hypothetical protein
MTAPAPGPIDPEEALARSVDVVRRATAALGRSRHHEEEHRDEFARATPGRDEKVAGGAGLLGIGGGVYTVAAMGIFAWPFIVPLAYGAFSARAIYKSNRDPENEKWMAQRYMALHPLRANKVRKDVKAFYEKTNPRVGIFDRIARLGDRAAAKLPGGKAREAHASARGVTDYVTGSLVYSAVAPISVPLILLDAVAKRSHMVRRYLSLRKLTRAAQADGFKKLYREADAPTPDGVEGNAGQEHGDAPEPEPDAPDLGPDAPEPDAPVPTVDETPTEDLGERPAWKHLTGEQQSAIRADFSQRRFDKVNEAHASEYTRVLEEIAALEPPAGIAQARDLANEILDAETVGGYAHQSSLMPRHHLTNQLLDSLHQIGTARSGTKLSAAKDLALATVEGRKDLVLDPAKDKPQPKIGVTLDQVRAVERAEVRAQRGAGMSL